jgi:hypothetical protein
LIKYNYDRLSPQLSHIEYLFEQNADCHCIIGGDYNVDFSRNWCHTALLNYFCDNNNLSPVIKHTCNKVDYTYNFSMTRFSILDNFLLSGVLFDTAVDSVDVLHCVDNTSDHDPLFLRLNIDIERVACSPRLTVDKIAWYKAESSHIVEYQAKLVDVDTLTIQHALHGMGFFR